MMDVIWLWIYGYYSLGIETIDWVIHDGCFVIMEGSKIFAQIIIGDNPGKTGQYTKF